MTKKDCLKTEFSNSKLRKNKFIAVAIDMKGNSGWEIIINPKENFDAKLEYYDKAYNDNLELNSCSDIRIVSAAGLWDGMTVPEIEDILMRNQF